jgi:WD40 repeat protein
MIQSAIVFQQYLILGGDKGSIWIYALGQYEHKISFQAHQLRVKSMKVFSMDGMNFLVTASSSGEISVWDVLEFLKEVDNIGQDYTLDGIQALSSLNLEKRVLCMEMA